MGTGFILIGFMGAGKTTVGRCLSGKTGYPLLDTDRLIEEQAGMTVSRIFKVFGEEEFRRLETETVKSLLDREGDWVLSAGGGLPLREENRELLRRAGKVIYLRARPGTVLNRLKGDTTRPLLQGGDVRERVESLMAFRGPLYESAAHMTVDTDGRSPEDISDEIVLLRSQA